MTHRPSSPALLLAAQLSRPVRWASAGMLGASLMATAAMPQTVTAERNGYGMPGVVDTPSADVWADTTIGATLGAAGNAKRATIAVQATPGLTMALRYTKFDDDLAPEGSDRSVDLHYQVVAEDFEGWRPAVAVGLRDLLGSGSYSAEYVVASKQLRPGLRASVGVGWGRLAGEARPVDFSDERAGFRSDDWFSGDAAAFGSISWDATDRLTLSAEYSHDDYRLERAMGGDEVEAGVNLAATWRFGEAYQVKAYTLGGETYGAQVSIALNPRAPRYPSGIEGAPAPVRPRAAPSQDPEGWAGHWAADPTAQPAIQTSLRDALAKEGLVLTAMSLSSKRAEIRIDNNRYHAQAQAIGRAARLMTRALPASVETFVITSVEAGVPVSSATVARTEVERLEHRPAAQIAQAVTFTDAAPRAPGLSYVPQTERPWGWGLKPYVDVAPSDPDESFRAEAGVALTGHYGMTNGFRVEGEIRQRLGGNYDQEAPGSLTVAQYEALSQADIEAGNSGAPRVRSDSSMYAGNDSAVVERLVASWTGKLRDDVYLRAQAGLFERAYGGVAVEALWSPTQSRFALGAEIAQVKKREFDDQFSFRDFEATTGFVSAYYDFGDGVQARADVGRYLAEDVGATVSLTRKFANGWEIGAYATRTDLNDDKDDEESFIKGVTLRAPISWGTGRPSQRTVGGTLRSSDGDAGARVELGRGLYDDIGELQTGRIYDGWGRFWR